MKTLVNFLKDSPAPILVFEALKSQELSAQFIAPNIPEARDKPVALVADASDDEQVNQELNTEFLKFCTKNELGYDDFPPDVRIWDHKARHPKDERPVYAPLNW